MFGVMYACMIIFIVVAVLAFVIFLCDVLPGLGIGLIFAAVLIVIVMINTWAQKRVEQQKEGKCLHCGASLAEDAVFCEVCGKPIVQVSCDECGYEFDESDSFCPKCGTKRISKKKKK